MAGDPSAPLCPLTGIRGCTRKHPRPRRRFRIFRRG